MKMDHAAEFYALQEARTPLRKVARHYGLTLDEMGRALHYARIAKTMKEAAERQAQRDLAQRLSQSLRQQPDKSFQPPAKQWCVQCERRVSANEAASCASAWCKAKVAA